MSSFGHILRVHILGESHGPVVGALVEGLPAGLELSPQDLLPDLQRRKGGRPGTTSRVEADEPRILSGLYQGRTTGDPVLVLLDNQAHDSSAYADVSALPRPGHADLTRQIRAGGHADPGGGGQASGRLTAPLVAAGAMAKKLLPEVRIQARVVQVGQPEPGDSAGGVVECVATGAPAGLGEPWWDGVESLLAHAALAIPGVKGFEIGDGFAVAHMSGSEHADAILDRHGASDTNHCGGALGGLTTGAPLVWRVAMRPAASIARPLDTVDLRTDQPTTRATTGRHDAAIALRLPVILEAVTALVLADLALLSGVVPRVLPAPGRDLGTLRRQIDQVDDELRDLVVWRLRLAQATRAHKSAVRDPSREEEVLARARGGELRDGFAEALFELLIAEATALQEDS